jgi:hypothetical protein
VLGVWTEVLSPGTYDSREVVGATTVTLITTRKNTLISIHWAATWFIIEPFNTVKRRQCPLSQVRGNSGSRDYSDLEGNRVWQTEDLHLCLIRTRGVGLYDRSFTVCVTALRKPESVFFFSNMAVSCLMILLKRPHIHT